MIATIGIIVHFLIMVALIIRVMTRPHRDPASRIAWIAVIAALPYLGVIVYLMFGEVNIGNRRVARMKKVLAQIPSVAAIRAGEEDNARAEVPEHYQHLFRTGHSISGFDVIGGNSARLMDDSNGPAIGSRSAQPT